MRIGIDFDNTIANYDGIFHAVAVEGGLIPADLDTSKNAVRDYLIELGREDAFTQLQGYVYGARMDLVAPYPDVADFVAAAVTAEHEVYIVSHKTRIPVLGPSYDMHAAARDFLAANGFFGTGMLEPKQVFFESTKEEKVARIASLAIEAFVDDLPDILRMPGFPPSTRAILFDPADAQAHGTAGLERYRDWRSIRDALLG